MKLKQIVISIENSPGRLLEVADALGRAGINLRAVPGGIWFSCSCGCWCLMSPGPGKY